DALLFALKQYDGTFVFISHDVYFINELAKNVLHVHSGRLTPYAGDYDYYLEKSKATNARTALTAGFTDARPKQDIPAARAAAPVAPGKKKTTPGEIKKLHIEVHRLEEEVAKLEARQNELAAALEAPETYSDKGKFHHLNLELSTLVDQLATATSAWETAAGKLAELEKA